MVRAIKTYLIYCHTHTATGWRYVGQTSRSMETRWRGHVLTALYWKRMYEHEILIRVEHPEWHLPMPHPPIQIVPPFQYAIMRSGPEAFEHAVLEEGIPAGQVNERGLFWITELNCFVPNGFNCQSPKGSKRRGGLAEFRRMMRDGRKLLPTIDVQLRGKWGGI